MCLLSDRRTIFLSFAWSKFKADGMLTEKMQFIDTKEYCTIKWAFNNNGVSAFVGFVKKSQKLLYFFIFLFWLIGE